ncbi:hypothetical protein DIPPA_01918 [Diplonema papillatum]|nr:hypothetical protein DIPPA_01918 [Diplonema papillatum]
MSDPELEFGRCVSTASLRAPAAAVALAKTPALAAAPHVAGDTLASATVAEAAICAGELPRAKCLKTLAFELAEPRELPRSKTVVLQTCLTINSFVLSVFDVLHINLCAIHPV